MELLCFFVTSDQRVVITAFLGFSVISFLSWLRFLDRQHSKQGVCSWHPLGWGLPGLPPWGSKPRDLVPCGVELPVLGPCAWVFLGYEAGLVQIVWREGLIKTALVVGKNKQK